MLGRHAEALEHRRRAVEHLAAPQQRVVGVVVGVRRIEEEADGDGHAEHAEDHRGDRAAAQNAGVRPVTRPVGRCTVHCPVHEAHHPNPVQGRGGSPPRHPARPPPPGPGVRRGRVAHHRRRLDGSDHRGRARARRRPHRPPDQQQGAGLRVPGGARRLPEARGGRHRQHRRGQPVLRPGRRAARAADPRRRGRHGRRRPRGHDDRALLAAQEEPAAPRLLGRAPGLVDLRAGHHVGLPRLQPRGRDLPPGGLALHLHARDDHPGGQDARGRRPRARADEREAARVAPVPVDVGLHPAQRRLDLPHLRDVRAAAGVHDRGRPGRRGRADRVGPLLLLLHVRGRRRPRAVADPRSRAVQRRDAAGRARRARRPAVRAAPDAAADLRARAPDRARARRAPVALRARRGRRAGRRRRRARAPAAAARTEEREALQL